MNYQNSDLFSETARQWMDWSVKTFELATSISSLNKAKTEIKELQLEILSEKDQQNTLMEYADVMMCLLHSAAKEGYTIQQLTSAISEKAEINYRRTWQLDPSGNTYSHIKS